MFTSVILWQRRATKKLRNLVMWKGAVSCVGVVLVGMKEFYPVRKQAADCTVIKILILIHHFLGCLSCSEEIRIDS